MEESGNMLIMTLSYTQATKDTSLITTYVPPSIITCSRRTVLNRLFAASSARPMDPVPDPRLLNSGQSAQVIS